MLGNVKTCDLEQLRAQSITMQKTRSVMFVPLVRKCFQYCVRLLFLVYGRVSLRGVSSVTFSISIGLGYSRPGDRSFSEKSLAAPKLNTAPLGYARQSWGREVPVMAVAFVHRRGRETVDTRCLGCQVSRNFTIADSIVRGPSLISYVLRRCPTGFATVASCWLPPPRSIR